MMDRRGSDADDIARLSGVLGYPVSADTMDQRLRRVLGRTEDVIFVAESPTIGMTWSGHDTEQANCGQVFRRLPEE
jgi:hypothetical protein